MAGSCYVNSAARDRQNLFGSDSQHSLTFFLRIHGCQIIDTWLPIDAVAVIGSSFVVCMSICETCGTRSTVQFHLLSNYLPNPDRILARVLPLA